MSLVCWETLMCLPLHSRCSCAMPNPEACSKYECVIHIIVIPNTIGNTNESYISYTLYQELTNSIFPEG